MALPTSKQESAYTPIEAGNYEAKLKSLYLDTAKEYMTDDQNEGEGLRYQSAEFTWDFGEDLTWTEKFVKVSTNDGAKFYNRICALLGRELVGGDDGDKIGWDLATDVIANLPLDHYFKPTEDDPEKGHVKGKWFITGETTFDGVKGNVLGLSVNGENLIGKSCMLELTINKKGYNAAKAAAATMLPKKPTTRKPPTAAATEAPAGIPT
jgi:hypothetical protein